jgi:hypothetical protein
MSFRSVRNVCFMRPACSYSVLQQVSKMQPPSAFTNMLTVCAAATQDYLVACLPAKLLSQLSD